MFNNVVCSRHELEKMVRKQQCLNKGTINVLRQISGLKTLKF
jgi:hypothetical protein